MKKLVTSRRLALFAFVLGAGGRVEMWEAKAGTQGWSEAEGPHTSENVGRTTMGFVLVEVKSAASAPVRR
jgi:hypothetical protein